MRKSGWTPTTCVLLWYADSHSTGDPDEDGLQDELADRFKAAARDVAAETS